MTEQLDNVAGQSLSERYCPPSIIAGFGSWAKTVNKDIDPASFSND